MRKMIITTTILFFISSLHAFAKPELLNVLYDNVGWEKLLETEDGISVSTKQIEGYDIKAVEVSKVVDVDPYSVVEVLEDVDSYNEILGKDRNMLCSLVDRGDRTIIGYQFYRIPIVRNRYVIFEMKKRYYSEAGDLRSEWILVSQEKHPEMFLPDYHYEEKPKSIDEGAGVWLFEAAEGGKWLITHRLYMSPGGWIPDFIVDRVNRKGVPKLFLDVINAARERNEVASVLEK